MNTICSTLITLQYGNIYPLRLRYLKLCCCHNNIYSLTSECFSLQGRNYSCCLHLSVCSVAVILPVILFKNEMGVKQEPAYVSNKKCHEQNRHILVPSPVVICTICYQFSWGLSKERKDEETSSV